MFIIFGRPLHVCICTALCVFWFDSIKIAQKGRIVVFLVLLLSAEKKQYSLK